MKTPEQQELEAKRLQAAQEYAPNDKLREYLAITTPEDKAAEWVSRRVEFSGEDESPNISHLIDKELKVAFLAGHATGKQEERERIWEAVKAKQSIAEFKDENLIAGAVSCRNLNSIIFGDEKL